MKVLITCPRAPVTIEWIRVFEKAGVDVVLVDSLKYPIAKYFNNSKYIRVASPKLDFKQYKEDMTKLIEEVDWVIPNCEDIFYLSLVREDIKSDTFFFMPKKELLFSLHHKFDFFKELNSYVKFPKTKMIKDKSEIEINSDTILKAVFSRFGQNVIRNVNEENIKDIEPSQKYPWVQQERLIGEAVCNYALILNGEVIASVVYKPKYLLNGAAATYFESYTDKRLDKFIEKFAKDSAYTGQIAFDFIDDGDNLYVLECNPRATSGLHLLGEGLKFEAEKITFSGNYKDASYRVGSTLYTLFGVQALLKGEFKMLHSDYKKAKDVLDGMPFYAQFLSLYEMIARSLIYKKPLTLASTFDIEFDG